jgi:hypothetical protein
MRILYKMIFLAFLLTTGCQALMAQYSRSYSAFTPVKNNNIRKFDTLRVGHCYNLDNTTAIGVIFRYWLVDMCVGVFKNNRNSEVAAAFDTVNVSDSTRLYFYRTSTPSDGVVIIWESKYIFDSELRAYLFRNGNVTNLGKIDVDLDDGEAASIAYPVSKIRIQTDGRRIKFTFTEHLKFRISQPFAPEDFYYFWEGGHQLIPVLKGVIGKPVW